MLKSYQGQIQNKSFSICDFILIFILNHWSGPRFAYLLMATSPSRLFIKVHLNNLSPVTTGVPRARLRDVLMTRSAKPLPSSLATSSNKLQLFFIFQLSCHLSFNSMGIWRKRRKDLEYDIDEHWCTKIILYLITCCVNVYLAFLTQTEDLFLDFPLTLDANEEVSCWCIKLLKHVRNII